MSDNHDIEKFRPGAGGSGSGMNPTSPLHGASAPRPNSLGRGHKKPHHKSKPKRPGRKSNKPNKPGTSKPNKPGTSRPNVRMPNNMSSSASNNGSIGNLNGNNNRNSPYGNHNNSQNGQNKQNNNSYRNNSRNGQGNFNPSNNNSQNRLTNGNSGNPADKLNNNNRSQGPGLNNFNSNSLNSSNNNSNNGYGLNNKSNNGYGSNNNSNNGYGSNNNSNKFDNSQGPSNKNLDDYANNDKDDKNSNSNDPKSDNLSDSNSDSSKDSNNPDDLNNPDSNNNDHQQGDPNDPNANDNRDSNDTSDKTDTTKKKGNDQDKGLLGKLKGLLTGKKKKKSFGDFLKNEKKRQKEKDQSNNDPAKKAKNLLQRILRLIRRIINLLRLYARAMQLFLMFKFVLIIQSVINWALGMFNMVISFFISIWAAAVGVLGSVGASLLAFLLGGFAFVLVFAMIAFFGWYSNQLALNNAQQQYYNECIKGSNGDTEENSPNGGSSAANLIKGRAPFNIKVKDDKTKNYNKAARNIAQAVHDYLKNKKHFDVPASWFFAQMFAEEGPSINGGTVQPVVSKDNNLAGMSGGYRGKTGTGHAEGDGGYSHYDNWSEFAGDWSSYLYKVVFTHKPKSIKDYLGMCIKAHYMTNWSTYYPAMQSGVTFYNHAGGAAGATGGSAEEADNNDNKDVKCGRTDEDFSGGDIVKEAKRWLGWFHYSQGLRMTLLGHWQHPEKDRYVDCSGFVWFVLKRCHVKVPSSPWATPFMESDARGNHKYLKQISRSEAGPGDIIIVNTGAGNGDNGHTAILLQKWHGRDTKIVEMGGDANHVNTSTVGNAFYSLLADGRVTIARVVHGGKHSSGGSGGGDTDLPKSEAAAKARIAQAESGGDWNARNGKYVGKYQCDISYFKGKDWHNHKRQSEVADRYVHSRYGSWKNALKFRLAHNSY